LHQKVNECRCGGPAGALPGSPLLSGNPVSLFDWLVPSIGFVDEPSGAI
jgi:hypothetical protein